MFNAEYFQTKRWFKGKEQKISKILVKDSFSAFSNTLFLVSVFFENGNEDLYAVLENENNVGEFLASLFDIQESSKFFYGEKGTFVVSRFSEFSSKGLNNLQLLKGEQSNSSFICLNEFFFKLFRRVSCGVHPEKEILHSFLQKNFLACPRLLGSLSYFENDSIYELGILETALSSSVSAFDSFKGSFSKEVSCKIGTRTFQMHQAMSDLPGVEHKRTPLSFEKFESLLKNSSEPLAKELLRKIPELKKKYESFLWNSHKLPCQRIHGDFHLGQLLFDKNDFVIVDFEGEPAKPLQERRVLNSVAVDLASMIRSFDYASAIFQQDCSLAIENFLKTYATLSQISLEEILESVKPFCFEKAIHEACYELEFRPDWLYVPAKALLSLNDF